MSRPLILLFDIDGTLVTTGGAGRRAIERAFEIHYGRKDAFDGFSFGGMTDRAILRAGLAAIGREMLESEIDVLLKSYVGILEEEVRAADRYFIHAGIEDALRRAAETERCAFGLGTGNIKDGARVKLNRVGIYDRFAFGGFGCDHEDRAMLLQIGAERGAQKLGAPLKECRIVVIGDTPKDVAAAIAIGADSIGVGTSFFLPEALAAAGATHAFANMAETGAIEAMLGR